MAERKRLSAADWTEAALAALVDTGVAAVAVEPLAKRRGATKGSFYWHFADRGALVDAALALWELRETDAVIADLATLDDPAERLRLLFQLVLTVPGADAVVQLARDVDDPRLRAAVERVTRRRLDYVVEQLRLTGLPEQEAQHRAVIAYATYLGWWQLRRVVPDVVPRGRRRCRTWLCCRRSSTRRTGSRRRERTSRRAQGSGRPRRRDGLAGGGARQGVLDAGTSSGHS